MSLLDLAPVETIRANLQKRQVQERTTEVVFLDSAIGPGRPWPEGIHWRRSYPLPLADGIAPSNIAMADLIPDPYMYETLGNSDLALLDTSDQARRNISPQGLYAISRREEVVLRYIRHSSRGYYLVTDASMHNPIQWERLRLPADAFSAIVKARVRWIGREQDRHLPPDQRGRFL